MNYAFGAASGLATGMAVGYSKNEEADLFMAFQTSLYMGAVTGATVVKVTFNKSSPLLSKIGRVAAEMIFNSIGGSVAVHFFSQACKAIDLCPAQQMTRLLENIQQAQALEQLKRGRACRGLQQTDWM